MGNSVSFFPLLPKHISTTPTSFPPFLGFQTGFQLCNLPGPRSIWLENWVTWKFHSFLRVMKTPRLCSVVLFMQKNTSVVWLTRKNKKKNTAEKRFWFVAIPFARKQKKVPWAFTLGGCLTYQMVTGNGNFWELDSPQLKEKKNACSPKLVAFQQVAIKCLHLLDSMLQFPTPIHGFVASTLLACHEFFLYNPTNPKITRSLYF